MRVSVIGLGNMGHPIARNLLAAGVELTVWNRTAARADNLVAAGARLAPSIADAALGDVVITMLADDSALAHVAFDERLVDRLRAGAIHVSMSTISVGLAERLTASHGERDGQFVSAPVFGRPAAAAARQLFVVAAGNVGALDACQPLFDTIGQRTFRFGDRPSIANVVKLSGNFLIASMIESLGEAVALVRKAGIDPHAYLDMLTATLFAAPVYKTYGGLIVDERYRPAGFSLPLGLKDVTLAIDAARGLTMPLPIASLVRDHMLAALAHGDADADWSVLAAHAARNAGL